MVISPTGLALPGRQASGPSCEQLCGLGGDQPKEGAALPGLGPGVNKHRKVAEHNQSSLSSADQHNQLLQASSAMLLHRDRLHPQTVSGGKPFLP